METEKENGPKLVIFASEYEEKVFDVDSHWTPGGSETFIVLADGTQTNDPAPFHMESRVKFGWRLSDDKNRSSEDTVVAEIPLPEADAGSAEQMFVALLRNYYDLEFELRQEQHSWSLLPGYHIMKLAVTAFVMGAEWRSENPDALIPRRDDKWGTGELDLCY